MTTDTRRDEAIERLRAYRKDFPLFAKHHLRIKTKEATIEPLVLNQAQKYVHRQFTEQMSRIGMVRAIILKGRQQGISTFVESWYYWQAALWRNISVYILSHEQPASDTLFDMVERMHRHNPLKPHVGTCNAKELVFDQLGSSYRVATAGAKAGGRSQMSTLFHGSEVAFWPSAADHFAASVQTVPTTRGTSVVLESTANGANGEFYERWQDAGRGCDKDGNPTDYIPIFIPWFWQKEYVRPVDDSFVLRTDKDDAGVSELDYYEQYQPSLEHMAWRRNKIAELRDPAKFRQEYPADPAEAFIASSDRSFIAPHIITRARKLRKDIKGYGPLILGVDPAGPGGDRFAIAARRGAKVLWVRARNKIDTVEGAAWVRDLIDELNPARVNIDAGGIGHGVISALRAFGKKYDKVTHAVNFGATSQRKLAQPKKPGPKNRRAEMWQRLKNWLSLEEGVSIPDDDVLQADLSSVSTKPSLSNDTVLKSKDEMRKEGLRSPDLGDAVALTFASLEHIEVGHAPEKEEPEFQSGVVREEQHWAPSAGRGSHTGWMR